MTSARRYEPLLKIASGGTASVWVGAAAGALGFRQLVAIKRPHEHLAGDPAFVAALVEEAKIASRLRHANAVDVRDVEADESGVQLVMDWVEGASLSDLIRAWQKERPARPHAVALRVVLDTCEGLTALHELASDDGAPLGCVHRDVSPANVLVGLDGVARITDFGLARPLLAVERTTSQGALRGKLGYMAPEYIRGKGIDHRVDVFAMGIVLWEALACRRLFRGENDAETLERVQRQDAARLIEVAPALGAAAAPLDRLLERALAKDPAARIEAIASMARELERIGREHDIIATHAEVRESFGPSLRATLEERRREVQRALSAQQDGAAVTPASVRPAATSSAGPSPLSAEAATQPGTPNALRPAGGQVRPARPLALAALALFFVAATVVLAVLVGRDATPLASAETGEGARRHVDPDVQPRAEDVRPRAASAQADSAPSSASRPRAARTGGASTTASNRTSASAEPTTKAPRPNPYAKP